MINFKLYNSFHDIQENKILYKQGIEYIDKIRIYILKYNELELYDKMMQQFNNNDFVKFLIKMLNNYLFVKNIENIKINNDNIEEIKNNKEYIIKIIINYIYNFFHIFNSPIHLKSFYITLINNIKDKKKINYKYYLNFLISTGIQYIALEEENYELNTVNINYIIKKIKSKNLDNTFLCFIEEIIFFKLYIFNEFFLIIENFKN